MTMMMVACRSSPSSLSRAAYNYRRGYGNVLRKSLPLITDNAKKVVRVYTRSCFSLSRSAFGEDFETDHERWNA